MDPDFPRRGTGPRLMTVAEAAELMRVSERAVQDWIEQGLISHEGFPDGSPGIRVTDELHERSGPVSTGFVMWDLHRGVDAKAVARFRAELPARRRDHQLEGLVWTDINADELTGLLAARFVEVVPDPSWVSAERGMVWVGGEGIDVASLVADSDGSVEERLIALGEIALDKASAGLAELTAEPWPAKPGEFPSGFPPFTATISGVELRMSYGLVNHPILELRPIGLDSIRIEPH